MYYIESLHPFHVEQHDPQCHACQREGDPGVDKGIDSNAKESDLLDFVGLYTARCDAKQWLKWARCRL